MYFETPSSADFADVHAFNRAYLRQLRSSVEQGPLSALSSDLRRRFAGLDEDEVDRLASVPFLLLAFRQEDDASSERREEAVVHGVAVPRVGDGASRTLANAALAYAWQLARRNPYALRLFCCASLRWCEHLAEQTLVSVLDRLAEIHEPLELRAAADYEVWYRLLTGGVDARADVRRSFHGSVQQSLLIRPTVRRRRALRSAACRTRQPVLRLSADD